MTTQEIAYYEVWVTDYDTFGESDSVLRAKIKREDSATKLAEIISSRWGSYARVQPVLEPMPITDPTPEEIEKNFIDYI